VAVGLPALRHVPSETDEPCFYCGSFRIGVEMTMSENDTVMTANETGEGTFAQLPSRSLIKKWRLNNNADEVNEQRVGDVIRANAASMEGRIDAIVNRITSPQS
jgi:hypothetical protein